MSLESLKAEIKAQRGVRTLGYIGQGVEVACDELEALIAVAEAAQDFVLDLAADGGGDLDKLQAAIEALKDAYTDSQEKK